ncbi:MFS transporter [Amycolatopsis pithecellobii]|uniref:MFS transporter n=1 Tax=Amycolatopsis pithecellobii TaxID=664692 RepID=A0A6N7YJI4_9PSEU|nr:MFS transporter [Amycolatopsis pithecellobii]MTD53057.1 MFS transporter [Amycolatopsis pithecellobii]
MTSHQYSSVGGASVAARLNRLPITRLHLFAVVIVGIGVFFEMYELFLAGTLGSVLTREYGIANGSTAQKLMLSSALIGAFIGAIWLNRIADRFGRRRAFFLTLSLYSVFSVLGAFSPNIEILVICRFIAGIGVGGELPLVDAYLSDLLPARVRGKFIGWAYTVGLLAVPGVGFLARGISTKSDVWGLAGWRWMFIIGGLGAAICWALRRFLPESPRWLESVGRTKEADAIVSRFERRAIAETGTLPEPDRTEAAPIGRARVRELFEPRWRKRTIMLWVFHFLQNFGFGSFGILAPIVLTVKGFDLNTGLVYAAITYIGYPVGSLLSLPIIERIERRTLVMLSSAGMIVCGLVFGFTNSEWLLLTAGFLYTAISNIFSNAYHVYQGELFPTQLRATGAGTGYSVSRIAGAVQPFVLLPLLKGYGSGAMFIGISVIMALLIINIAAFGPRTTGRSLEEVNATKDDDTVLTETPAPTKALSQD